MFSKINTLLSPLEKGIKTYKKYIGYVILSLSFLSFFYLLDEKSVKESGEKALFVLWIVLWIPIGAKVLGIHIFHELLSLRKELGILMGCLALVHGSRYIISDPTFILTSYFWVYDGMVNFLAFGAIALVFTFLLTITSNLWSMRMLGKYWKILHRTVYIIIIFTVAHVALLKWSVEFEFGSILLLLAYFIGKSLEWKGISFTKAGESPISKKGQKYICIPCGYIYDPLLGDEDSGIAPGTEFSDIPDSWRCPVCGVSKSDFTPYEEGTEEKIYTSTVIEKTFLNSTTLELIVETENDLESKPGQFMTFVFEDDQGTFTRQYSIARQSGNLYTFTIKLGEQGRGALYIRNLEVHSKVRLKGIFGNFLLQDTKNPKVFIATGTGLAPIYHMLSSLEETNQRNTLYFSVATKDDLFYQDKLLTLQNIDLHICTTREQVDGCEHGRINVDTISATPETEWYLCGNPKMVQEAQEKLTARGFGNIYSEEFS